MASNICFNRALYGFVLRQARQSRFRYNAGSSCAQVHRSHSTETPQTPPLLAKLKADLKAAMIAKDTDRLSVLRAIFAATANAAKTSTPIRTDVQLVQFMHKAARRNQEAAAEARAAGREDLVKKEEAQIKIIEEYMAKSGSQEMDKDEMKSVVEAIVRGLGAEAIDKKRLLGEVMKRLLAGDGPLQDKQVNGRELAQIAKEMTG